MSLIEDQFEEKINFYDNNFGFIKDKFKSKINLDISNSNNSFLKNLENSTTSYFDKIYSNFYLLQNNNTSISNNSKELSDNKINNFNDENIYFKIEKSQKITLNSKNENNKSKRKNNSKKLLNKNKKNYKNYEINIPNKNFEDVGERLYNNSFLTKEKIEKKRKMQEINFKKQLIPHITSKGKKVKGDQKRLYNENIVKKMRKVLSQKNILEKDKSCSFRPTLNKKSLKIAEKLEPSTSRLNKKITKINKDEIFDLTKKNYSNLFGNKNLKKYKKSENNSNKKLNRSMEEINKRIDDFYQKQIKAIKQKEKIYNENKLKKEEEYQKYPFHPIINHKKSNITLNKTYINKYINTFERLYKTNKTCKRKINFNELKLKSNENCTFRPQISPLNIKDDQKMIMNNIIQSNLYIQKRRKNIENQKKSLEYKNKKLGNIYGLFKPAIAIKDNGLRTEKRCNSKTDKSLNKEETNKYIITKGTIDFNNTNSNNDEKIFYYLNDKNKNPNINIIKYNNIKHNLNQQEFLNAVNALHNQISNLNI